MGILKLAHDARASALSEKDGWARAARASKTDGFPEMPVSRHPGVVLTVGLIQICQGGLDRDGGLDPADRRVWAGPWLPWLQGGRAGQSRLEGGRASAEIARWTMQDTDTWSAWLRLGKVPKTSPGEFQAFFRRGMTDPWDCGEAAMDLQRSQWIYCGKGPRGKA